MPSRIPLDELARLPSLYLPNASWSRDKIAFYWDKTGRIELYVLDLNTRQIKQLSHGEVPRAVRAQFAWDRADENIVFGKDRDGNEQHDLYSIDVKTGEVKQLTDDPKCQEYPIESSPDNRWLTVTSNKRGQLNLFKIRADGSDYTQLTNYSNPVMAGGIWSPDGERIAYSVNESPDLKNLDIYVMRADGSEARRILRVSEGSRDVVADWSPDGAWLAITSDAGGDNRPGLLSWQTGSVRWLGEQGVDESAMRFADDGKWLVCLRNQDSQMRPVLYSIETGERRDLKLPAGIAVGSQFVLNDTALVTIFATDTARPSMWLYDLENDSYATLIGAEYGSIDPNIFVESEYVWYVSFDGVKIPAILYKPKNIARGTRLPAIVHVHGGPTAQWFRGFDPYAQFLMDAGFVVFEPNIRGSTGYGVKFRDSNLRDWGGADLEDVACAVDFLKSQPFVDGNRIGIFGGSYGGYMAYMATTKKPDLWKAAVAWVGITDLHRLYESSMEHFKYGLRYYMGDPNENADLWRERSPVNFAQNLRARLLIVHGENDPRCPLDQARIFRDRLIEHGKVEGKDFEYVELTGEGHGSTDIEQKIRAYSLLVNFMERNL
jgi:dipeptidyl aminopeptidase/acylaminoacyl peptidase